MPRSDALSVIVKSPPGADTVACAGTAAARPAATASDTTMISVR